jgi:hypothetical protein
MKFARCAPWSPAPRSRSRRNAALKSRRPAVSGALVQYFRAAQSIPGVDRPRGVVLSGSGFFGRESGAKFSRMYPIFRTAQLSEAGSADLGPRCRRPATEL